MFKITYSVLNTTFIPPVNLIYLYFEPKLHFNDTVKVF